MQRGIDVTVAVVGSGPAGAATAAYLADAGVDTLLIDHRRFPRGKACGEYLNELAVARLAELGIAERLRAQAAVLRGMRLHAHHERVEFPFERELWSIPRVLLDDAIRRRAIAAGAQTLTARVLNAEDDAQSVVLHLRDERGTKHAVRAAYVAGADGMHSTIARRKIPDAPGIRFAVGGHYRIGASLEGWVEMFRTPVGYLALNPLTGGNANAMCVVRAEALHSWRHDVDGAIREFSIEASDGKRTLEPHERDGERVSIGPLVAFERVAADRHRVLVGDAAAFLDPFTGQGIAFALTAAKLASAALIRTLRESDRHALLEYAQTVSRFVRERRRVAHLIEIVLQQRFLAHVAAQRVRESPALTRALVDLVAGTSRDESPLLALTHLAGAVLR